MFSRLTVASIRSPSSSNAAPVSVTSGKLTGAKVEVVVVEEVVVELFTNTPPAGTEVEAGLVTAFAVVVGAATGFGEAVLLGAAVFDGATVVTVDATDVDVDVDATVVVVVAAVVVVVVVAAVVVVDTVVSIVTDNAETAELGPVFDEASRTELAERRATIVPSDEHVTEIVTVLPDAAAGVNTHPVAVPVFEKSPPTIPDTASLNVSVYVRVRELEGDDGVVHDAVGGVKSTEKEVLLKTPLE